MKYKYFAILLFALMLALSIGAAAAEEVEIEGDYSFTVPDGYEVVDDSGEPSIILENKKGDRIVFQDWIEDYDTFLYLKENASLKGIIKSFAEDADIGDEENYTFEDYDVTQLKFVIDNTPYYLYVLGDGEKGFLVYYLDHNDIKDLNEPDNAVGELIKSIK